MTREEVAERLKAILAEATAYEDAVCYVTSDDADALDMAIKALEQEPCDCISREDAMSMILCYGNEIKIEVMNDIKASMIKLPSVTPQPKMGRWMHPYKSDIACECSECHIQIPITKDFKYCPNCGAKMEVSE